MMKNRTLINEELKRFNQIMGYNPSKGLIKEETLLTEGIIDLFKNFRHNKNEIKDELFDKFGIERKDSRGEIKNKLKNKFKDNISKEEAKRESSKVGGDLGNMLLFFLKGFLGWAAIQSAREYSILEFLAYVIALFLVWGFQGKSYDDEDKWW